MITPLETIEILLELSWNVNVALTVTSLSKVITVCPQELYINMEAKSIFLSNISKANEQIASSWHRI